MPSNWFFEATFRRETPSCLFCDLTRSRPVTCKTYLPPRSVTYLTTQKTFNFNTLHIAPALNPKQKEIQHTRKVLCDGDVADTSRVGFSKGQRKRAIRYQNNASGQMTESEHVHKRFLWRHNMVFEKQTLNRVYRYCLSLTTEPEAAYDLMQTGIERYLRMQANRADAAQDEPSKPLSYLFRIVRNAHIDQKRRTKGKSWESWEDAQTEVHTNVVCAGFQSLDDILIDRERVEAVMSQLPDSHRELLFLWAVEGYTVQEISDLMEVPRGTLLARLHRIRQKIKASLIATPQADSGIREAWG